jgi:hypothetical protein
MRVTGLVSERRRFSSIFCRSSRSPSVPPGHSRVRYYAQLAVFNHLLFKFRLNASHLLRQDVGAVLKLFGSKVVSVSSESLNFFGKNRSWHMLLLSGSMLTRHAGQSSMTDPSSCCDCCRVCSACWRAFNSFSNAAWVAANRAASTSTCSR